VNLSMNLDIVREQFEQIAFNYDGLIPRLIPHYREQHDIILQLIHFETNANIKVLDLGAGTGILSAMILQAFPQANVTAFDMAENMLKICQTNLSAFGERLTLQQGNFAEDDFGSGYDLVVSGLAIHHLEREGKQQLFHKLFNSMNAGGILLIRDIVTGATPKLTEQYENLWRQYMKANGEDDAAWFQNYLKEDIPSSVEEQTKWLAEAGFADAACHWRHLNFAIFGGVIAN
jgi:tRNA (cmo5U34)-methyltransferase